MWLDERILYALSLSCACAVVCGVLLLRRKQKETLPRVRELKGESFEIPFIPYKPKPAPVPGNWAFNLYQAKPLLTEWERKVMFGIIKQVPRNYILLAQVRYADFVAVDSLGTRSADRAFYQIANKSADLVVMERWTGAVVLVVELNDDTHQRADRTKRDQYIKGMLEHIGIPLLSFTPRDSVNIEAFFANLVKK